MPSLIARRQLLVEDLVGRFADDEVEAVVDDGLAARALVVVGDGRRDGGAAMLRRERDDGGRAAERGGNRAAVEVVGGHDAHAGELLDMAMAVDAAGKHVAARGVDVAGACRKLFRHRDDLLAADADVAAHRLGGGRHGAVADGEVELFHGFSRPPPRRRPDCGRRAWRDTPPRRRGPEAAPARGSRPSRSRRRR